MVIVFLYRRMLSISIDYHSWREYLVPIWADFIGYTEGRFQLSLYHINGNDSLSWENELSQD